MSFEIGSRQFVCKSNFRAFRRGRSSPHPAPIILSQQQSPKSQNSAHFVHFNLSKPLYPSNFAKSQGTKYPNFVPKHGTPTDGTKPQSGGIKQERKKCSNIPKARGLNMFKAQDRTPWVFRKLEKILPGDKLEPVPSSPNIRNRVTS